MESEPEAEEGTDHYGDFTKLFTTLIEQADRDDNNSDSESDIEVEPPTIRSSIQQPLLPPLPPPLPPPHSHTHACRPAHTHISLATLFNYANAEKNDTLAFYWKGGLNNLYHCKRAAEAAHRNEYLEPESS